MLDFLPFKPLITLHMIKLLLGMGQELYYAHVCFNNILENIP